MLDQRAKQKAATMNLAIDDASLQHKDNLGRVVEFYTDNDNLIRAVRLHISTDLRDKIRKDS